jgi:hypothetical protein
MLDKTRTPSSDRVIEPLLLDIARDRELNAILQKHSSVEQVKIEIKVSHPEKELFLLAKLKFNAPCPCNQHTSPTCFHSVDAAGNPICS